MVWQIIAAAEAVILVFFTCWTFFWNRKQKLHDSLSEILKIYVLSLRKLTDANNTRKTAESLELSFPDGGKNGDALKKHQALIVEYNLLIEGGRQSCLNFENEVASNIFRFPVLIAEEFKSLREELFNFGSLVNQGMWNAADIQAGHLKDRYGTLVRLARGWCFSNLFKGFGSKNTNKKLQAISKQIEDSQKKFDIPKERIDLICRLIHKRWTTESQHPFAIHPPQEIIENPELIKGSINIDKLRNMKFKIAFYDGENQILDFCELMIFVYQLIFLEKEARDIISKLEKGGFGKAEVTLKTEISPRNIMQQATVDVLVQKIDFSPIPAEAI